MYISKIEPCGTSFQFISRKNGDEWSFVSLCYFLKKLYDFQPFSSAIAYSQHMSFLIDYDMFGIFSN